MILQRRQAGLAPRGTLGTGLLPTVPLRGTVRGLHIAVRFPQDADSLPEHTNAFYQRLLWDGSNPRSVSAYWRENSLGQFNLTGDTVGPIIFGSSSNQPLGVPRGAAGTAGTFTNSVIANAGKTALTQIVSQISATTDFSRYDSDGDGRVDLVIVTFPLLNTATATLQSLATTPGNAAGYLSDPLSLTAFRLSLPQNRILGVPPPFTDPIQTQNGVVIDQWIFMGEDFTFRANAANVATTPQNGASVYAHEIGHGFGLPDLIDESGLIPSPSAGSGLFDGMSLGNRNLPDQLNGQPTVGFDPNSFLGGIVHSTSWAKFALGFITPINVSGTLTNQTIRPVEQFADVFKLNVNADSRSSEYFLIENRQNVGVFDTNLVGTRILAANPSPGTGPSQQPIHGLLLWHIDEAVIQNSIITNQPASDPNFPGIKLVQADGRDDMFRPLPTIFGGPPNIAMFDLVTFGFTGFSPTGNDGDDSDSFPGTFASVHIGDGSDGNPFLLTQTGMTPANNRASTLTYAGTQSGIIVTNIREQAGLPGQGNNVTANLTSRTLASLTTSTLTIVTPTNGDRLENFTPTIIAVCATTHPEGVQGNPIVNSSINITISGVPGTQVDIDGDGQLDGVAFVTNGVVINVPGIGQGTLRVDADCTITFQPPPLPAGTHTVKIVARNLLGQTLVASVTFTLQQRRIRGGLSMISFPFRFTQPLPDGSELQPNSPLSQFRFSDLASGSPQVVLGVQNPTFGRFELRLFGDMLTGQSTSPSPYHIFQVNPPHTLVNLDPFVDVIFPGLGYWTRIDPLGILIQIQGRSIPTIGNLRIIHEDSDTAGTLPVYDLSNRRLTYAATTGTTIGWRMVGNPFPFPVSYNSMQVRFQGQLMTMAQAIAINPPILSPAFFRFDSVSQQYVLDVAPNGILNPFDAVWINFLQPMQLEVSPLRASNSVVLPVSSIRRSATNNVSGWTMRLSARASDAADVENYIGAQSGASDRVDAHDIPKPPDYPGNHLRLNLMSPTTTTAGHGSPAMVRLMRDLRAGPVTRSQRYDFEVETDLLNTDVHLTWDDAGKVPGRYRLTFVDTETGRRLYMRTTTGYTFNSGNNGRRLFRIEVEPTSGTEMRVQHVATSLAADGRTVRVSYSLTQRASISTRIVNAAGKVVRRFASVQGEKGLNILQWDGHDDTGRRLSRGLYIIRIEAQTDEQQIGQGVASVVLK